MPIMQAHKIKNSARPRALSRFPAVHKGVYTILGCPATFFVVRYTQRDRRQRDWALPLGACVKCACGRAKVARGYGNRWTDASAPAALVHTDAKKLT